MEGQRERRKSKKERKRKHPQKQNKTTSTRTCFQEHQGQGTAPALRRAPTTETPLVSSEQQQRLRCHCTAVQTNCCNLYLFEPIAALVRAHQIMCAARIEILRCSAASVSDFDGLMCVPRAQAILRKGGFLKVGAEDLLSLPVCELQELVSLAQRYQSEVRALGTRRRLGALCQFWLDRRLPSALVEAVSSFLPARVDLDFRASAPVSGLLSVRCVGSWRASEHGLMPCKSACFLSFSFSLSSSLSFSFSHV